jgi:anhydro-N-acetylmuramic acid kinase
MDNLYIGLLSGTSVDAIDAALVDFSEASPKLIAYHSHPIPENLRQQLLALTQKQEDELHLTMQADSALGILFGEAVLQLIKKAGVSADQICAIGSHGQTLRHQPDNEISYTLQIGDPNRIAAITNITTIADFRRLDLAHGGQGAPLAPAFHAQVFYSAQETRAIVNIGGFSNVTILNKDISQPVLGFDTGPGNALIDAWIQECLDRPYDKNGDWASKGTLIPELFDAFLADPFLKRTGPKSTGKDFFNITWLRRHLALLDISEEPRAQDIQYTLTEFTAYSISQKLLEASNIERIFICGGGAHNTFLMSRLANWCAPIAIHTTSDLGIPPDWVEAALFAWLAKQRLEGKALDLKSITGSKKAVLLGAMYL